MASGVKWGCSYEKTTLIGCCINIVVAPLYVYSSNNDLNNIVKYTLDQIRKTEESVRIRRANEHTQLVKIMKELKKDFTREETMVEFPREVKYRITEEICRD